MAFTISYNIKAIDQFTEVSRRINSALSELDSNIKKTNVSGLKFKNTFNGITVRTEQATAAISKNSKNVVGLTAVETRHKDVMNELNLKIADHKRKISDSNMKIKEHALATRIANRQIREANKVIRDNKQRLAERNRKFRESIALQKQVGAGLSRAGGFINTRVTLPLLAAGGASVKFAMDFNKSMANVSTLIPGQTEKLQQYKKEVLDLSVKYGKGSDVVSSGLYQVISNVGDTADTMKILDISNKAAVAGVADTAAAVDLLTGVSSDYGDVSAEMVQRISDLAFKAVKLGSTTFPELAQQMGRTTTQSKTLGISLEELFGMYAGLTSGTVKTDKVSTRLAGVMNVLTKNTGPLKKVLGKLGVQSGKELIAKFGGLQGALFALKREVGGNEIAFAKLFEDQEARLAALALTGAKAKEAASEIKQMSDATGASNIAFKEQSEKVNATGFKFEQSKQRVARMAITIGDKLMPQVEKLLNAATPIIDWLSSLDEDTIRAAMNFGILAAKFGIAAKVLGTLLQMKAGLSGLIAQFGGQGGLAGAIGSANSEAVQLTGSLKAVNAAVGVMASFGAGYAIGEFIHHTWMEPAEQSREARQADIGNVAATVSMVSKRKGMSDAELIQLKDKLRGLKDAIPKTDLEAAFESPTALIETLASNFTDTERPIDAARQNFEKAARAFAQVEQELVSRRNKRIEGGDINLNRKDTIDVNIVTQQGTVAEVKHRKKGNYSAVNVGKNVR